MASWRRPAILAVLVTSLACGGGSPSAPTIGDNGSPLAFRGVAVSAIDGRPIGGVSVRIGSHSAISDANGAFSVSDVPSGQASATIAGSSIIERHLYVTMPLTEPARASLIPGSFDLPAFDEMFRGEDGLRRWMSPPSLVVLTSVMKYVNGLDDREEYLPTTEQLTDAETNELIGQLTQALAFLTGNTFTSFASVEREASPPGVRVSTLRTGKIVVGRYRGIRGLTSIIGFGRWATDESGQVAGGAVYLDADFDKSNDARRLLRFHELGHALGYRHVTTRPSIMNPYVGPEPTAFDREGSIIAFQRQPGNQTPDNDFTGHFIPGVGGSGVGPQSTKPPVWSPRIACGAPR